MELINMVKEYKKLFREQTSKGILQIVRDSCEALIEKEVHDNPVLDKYIKQKLTDHLGASLPILRERWKLN